jgi:hypothetical protein
VNWLRIRRFQVQLLMGAPLLNTHFSTQKPQILRLSAHLEHPLDVFCV